MNNLIHAARQALEALELDAYGEPPRYERNAAIAALRAALEKTVHPNPPLYSGDYVEGVMAERKRIVNLLMIQHEMAKGAHNYWNVAAQLIQADVASDT